MSFSLAPPSWPGLHPPANTPRSHDVGDQFGTHKLMVVLNLDVTDAENVICNLPGLYFSPALSR